MENTIENLESDTAGVNATIGRLEVKVGNLDVRVGKLESDVEYIKRDVSELRTDVRELRTHQERDFRLLFSVIIFVALGITGMLAKQFGWIH